jgi:hypothetical protein
LTSNALFRFLLHLRCAGWPVSGNFKTALKFQVLDASDPRVAKVLDEIGAKDTQRHSVGGSLLPVDEPVSHNF